MKELANIEFNVPISAQRIENKDENVWGRLTYTTERTDKETFLRKLAEGYAFTSLMNTPSFTVRDKKDANWRGSQLLVFDLDNVKSKYNMSDFLSSLQYPHSMAYTSQNDHIPSKGSINCRFRLIYVFEEPITSKEIYQGIYDYIKSTFDTSFFDPSNAFDNTSRSVSHQYAGNATSNMEMAATDWVYSISDFSEHVSSSVKKKEQKDEAITRTDLDVSEGFLKDLNSLQPSDFLEKYRYTYHYQAESIVTYNNSGYAVLDDSYTKIYHPFDKTTGKPLIYHDGQGRRHKLFVKGLLHKRVKQDISDEELVYNLIYDRYHFFDNSDNVLNNKTLLDIAEGVKNTPTDELAVKHPKLKIDKEFCKDNGISPNQYRPMLMKEIIDTLISKFYNPNLSVKTNLERLNCYGIKIGKTKLYEFCKERKISTKGNKQYGYKPTEASLATCSDCPLVKAVISHYKVY